MRIKERLPKVTQIFDVFEKHTWLHWLSSRGRKIRTQWGKYMVSRVKIIGCSLSTSLYTWSADTIKIKLTLLKGRFVHLVKYGVFSVTFGLSRIGFKLVA